MADQHQMTIQFDSGQAQHFMCECAAARIYKATSKCTQEMIDAKIPRFFSFRHAFEAGWRFTKDRKGHCPTCIAELHERMHVRQDEIDKNRS